MGAQQEAEVDQAVDMEQQTEDVRNAAAFQEVHQVFQELQQDIDSTRQRIEPTGADAEQAAEVEQMYRDTAKHAALRKRQTAGDGITGGAGSDTACSSTRVPTMGHNQVRGRQGSLQVATGGRGHHSRQEQTASCRTVAAATNRRRRGRA